MVLSTVLRKWLFLLSLVHHATSAFSMFGCREGSFCAKQPKSKNVWHDLSARGYELIGFMPTFGDYSNKDKKAWIKNSIIQNEPLGPGAYVFQNGIFDMTFLKGVEHPKVCSVFARRDKLEKWSWINVPKYVRTINNEIIPPYNSHVDPKVLKSYLRLLGYGDQEHSGVLVSTGVNEINTSIRDEESYTMRIPNSKLDDTVFYCVAWNELLTPEDRELIFSAGLNWSEKFRSDWRIQNYPTAEEVPAKEWRALIPY